MNATAALKVKELTDYLITEDEIKKKVESREHMFELIDPEDHSFGYISLLDLKEYISTHNDDDVSTFKVRNIDSLEVLAIFEHPFFQRRKPQLVSIDTLKNNDDDQEFYLLIRGQKSGPYEKYELTDMLDKKELLLTDLVSYNAGHTWVKIYQVEAFDRRTRNNDELPGLPKDGIINQDGKTGVFKKIGETTDGMLSLAYLGNAKKEKIIEKEQFDHAKEKLKDARNETSWFKWLFIFSIIGIVYFTNSIKNKISNAFETDKSNAIGEKVEMLTPVSNEQINYKQEVGEKTNYRMNNDQRRIGKFETRNLPPIKYNRRNKSFTEGHKYKEMQASENTDAANDSDNYYFDNAAPMELDPIRAQISKENFNDADGSAEPAPAPAPDETIKGL